MTPDELENILNHVDKRWWQGWAHSAVETATVVSAYALVSIAKSLQQIAKKEGR